MKKFTIRGLLAATSIMLATTLSAGAPTAVIKESWEGHKKAGHCYAISFPKTDRSVPEDRYLSVAVWAKDKIKDEVAIASGFGEAENVEGSVKVDGNLPFKLLVYKGTGFLKSSDIEQMLITQMKAGRSLEVKWTTQDGKYHVDTYDLYGFTASRAFTHPCK